MKKHYLNESKKTWFQHYDLPKRLYFSKSELIKLWKLHPKEFHIIKMFGKNIPTPRW